MNDYLSGFDDWTQAFEDWTDISISELHGLMTAIVCALNPPKQDEWIKLLDELSLVSLPDKALELLDEYAQDVSFALKDCDDAYEYTPLVPDDEHDLYERLIALKNWASGFITGVGITEMTLSDDDREQLTYLCKIASIRPTPSDEEEDGEGEEIYSQFYEFARMVPITLAMRKKRAVRDLALIKGLDMGRKTAQEEHQLNDKG